MSKGDDYRQMAEDLRARDRHADADVLESLAREADRLDRLQPPDHRRGGRPATDGDDERRPCLDVARYRPATPDH